MNHQRTLRKPGISLPEKPERQGASRWHPHNTPCRSALPSQRFFTKHEIAPNVSATGESTLRRGRPACEH